MPCSHARGQPVCVLRWAGDALVAPISAVAAAVCCSGRLQAGCRGGVNGVVLCLFAGLTCSCARPLAICVCGLRERVDLRLQGVGAAAACRSTGTGLLIIRTFSEEQMQRVQ